MNELDSNGFKHQINMMTKKDEETKYERKKILQYIP